MSDARARLEAIRTEQAEILAYMRENLSMPTADRELCAEIFDRLTEIAAELEKENPCPLK